MEQITFIIKTMERLPCVSKLVKSIYHYYPNAIILIADDGEHTCKDYFDKKYSKKNLQVFKLPQDSGLSYGRNFLVRKVKTPYFVLLDDDFVFDKNTNINAALSTLVSNKLDIVGGFIRTYQTVYSRKTKVKRIWQELFGRPIWQNYIGTFSFDPSSKVLYVDYINNSFPDFIRTDIVLNFFVAKTDVIRDVNPWDNDLKLQEHTAFFYQAKSNGLKIGFTNALSIQHLPERTPQYQAYRGRNYFQLFLEKNDITCFTSTINGIKQPPTFCERSNHIAEK